MVTAVLVAKATLLISSLPKTLSVAKLVHRRAVYYWSINQRPGPRIPLAYERGAEEDIQVREEHWIIAHPRS
jgi:hypothetical protein